MFCSFIEEKHLNKFVSIYLDYKDEVLNNLYVKIKEKTDNQIVADVLIKNKDLTYFYLGQLTIDDFNFKFTLFKQNKINEEVLRFNGNYQHMFYSKNWRKFITTALEKKFGQEMAEDYVESFLSTNIGDVKEYNKLMQIAYRRADYNPFETEEEKGKE